MTLYDVVKKLTGDILPGGDTIEDNKRFENLQAMTELIGSLMVDILMIEPLKYSKGLSEKRAGQFAHDFLDDQGIGV